MKKILLIATGGTIASQSTTAGLAPQMSSQEILAAVPQVAQLCEIDTVQLFNLDSTDLCSPHWLAIAQCIRERYEQYSGFVITHGTDTMAYTSAMLSYLIQCSPKPIVLTGSQKPIALSDTDARDNLINAFLYACDERACGVHIVFDGKVIVGTRARKFRTKSYNAFSSIDYPEVAVVRGGKVIGYIEEKNQSCKPCFFDRIDPRVFVLKMTPGVDLSLLNQLQADYDGVVIESFGVGGIPNVESECTAQALEQWVSAGKPLVVTTQVTLEGSDMEVYRVGQVAKQKYNLMEAYNMTLEAVTAKLMWILGQTHDPALVRELFYQPVAHDILE